MSIYCGIIALDGGQGSSWNRPWVSLPEMIVLIKKTFSRSFKDLLIFFVAKDNVLDPGKGVCADPVETVAILEVKGLGPPGGVSECQLSPERGGEKT